MSVGTTRAARQKHGWKGVSASAVASRAFWRRSERASEWVGERTERCSRAVCERQTMTASHLDIQMRRTGVEERASEDRGDGRLRRPGSLHKSARLSASLFSPSACTYIPSSRSEPALFPASFSLRRSYLTHATQAASRGLFLRSDHLSPTCRRCSSSLSPADHHHTSPSDAHAMYIHVPLLLLLLATATPSAAALFSRDSES